jgi:acetyl-CoA C-acetyltransferase
MAIDGATVVLVGASAVDQRVDDPTDGVEAIALMHRAVDGAADDAGCRTLLDRVDWIGIPEGTWGYRDPAALLAERLGRDRAGVHTVIADVGILQQDLITRAIHAVTAGASVALVAGGEAKHRNLRGVITGAAASETTQPDGVVPDERMAPGSLAALGVHDLEIVRNTVTPVAAYALIENAIGHALDRSLDGHRDHVARLWARFAAVAAENPHAWDRAGHDAAAIRDAQDGNRMISFPYTKRHSAQWNVDQAAALFLCSVATARSLGIAEDRWVFPHAAAVCNHAVAVSERVDLHRCPGADAAGPRALELAGVTTDDVAHVDLYSCFPSAVELLAAAIDLDADDPRRPLTVTGGLAFAGGPLNNYVLQAMVELAHRLRGDAAREAFGLSTSVSGFLVKQGFGVWSSAPPRHGFRAEDLTAPVAATTPALRVVADADGAAVVVSFTVDVVGGEPSRTVVIADVPDGTRTIAANDDADLARRWMTVDPIGTDIDVRGGAFTAG